ncbi:MAG: nodulation protein NfeD [Candidatus Bipolaricaulis sibiricus]|uniref:Nodulation protein NfeD n=1 Tax=Bipolaricaulis sibiricus TaxID=2501609 RepID=A0A410FSR2_BIPS1|nr:MAG: nodulation protein NfeD [Candidatus Bipolaricaulis sibiricus]
MRRSVIAAVAFLVVSLAGTGEVVRLSLDGTVNPATSAYVVRGLAEADRIGASLVVLVLDTPGGLDTAMKEMVEAILASKVPVVVWVGPAGARAASAGTFILVSADVAAMARGTSTGAAHPVAITGETAKEDDPVIQKAVNDAVSRIRSVAELRGRNADWVERAVRESATVTATEALDLGVIELLADSFASLLAALDGYTLRDGRTLRTAGVPVREIGMTFKDRLFSYLADPNLVYILLMLGLYGLIYEFFTPGIGIGLVGGGISLLLALLGLQVLPISFVGVALILFGVLLMVLDALTPTDGILTIGGVVSLVIGSFSLFELEGTPLRLSWITVATTVGTLTLLFLFIASKGLLAQRRKPRPLTTMVGLSGVAKDDLQPEGWVFVKGEYWRARAEGEPVHAGDRVRVVGQNRSRLTVRRED